MQGKNLPIVIIVVGVLLAGGAALFLKRGSEPTGDPKDPPPVSTVPSGPSGGVNAASLAGGRVHGKADAKLTLVEFGDFQCPSCGVYHPIVSELLEDSPDLVKLEFHHFPLLGVHPNALAAAVAAEAAGDQGKYWEMHALLFERQPVWSNLGQKEAAETFTAFAREVGIDTAKFQQALKSMEIQERVLEDVKRGNSVQVDATPTFYINGQKLQPVPQTMQGFRQALLERAPVAVAK